MTAAVRVQNLVDVKVLKKDIHLGLLLVGVLARMMVAYLVGWRVLKLVVSLEAY